MRILVWHVHGSWTTAFVQGGHDYLVPVVPQRDADGLGRARTWDWPDSVREVPLDDLAGCDPDVVVLQRPRDLELTRTHLRREPGRDLPAVWVEHNTPRGDVGDARHVLADRDDVPVVHVTAFNQVFWDCGRAPTSVIEHGVVDPGLRYTGELPRTAVAVNEPVRRGRVTGTDLLPGFAAVSPLDVFGMQVTGLAAHLGVAPEALAEHEDLPQSELHRQLPRRRVYLHPHRWTSLGLSLLEAMHLGMPVVVLATTEATEAVPTGAGVVSTRLDVLRAAVRDYLHDPELARVTGLRAREAALDRYSLDRFRTDWDRLLKEVT
jgi:glycosyltransferase involved in cell wall biosynthesis